jgi:iron complex transport system ATP-binding protein
MVSSRVVVMNHGRIIANGLPEEVITSPMIRDVYGINADLITHNTNTWCIPTFSKGAL